MPTSSPPLRTAPRHVAGAARKEDTEWQTWERRPAGAGKGVGCRSWHRHEPAGPRFRSPLVRRAGVAPAARGLGYLPAQVSLPHISPCPGRLARKSKRGGRPDRHCDTLEGRSPSLNAFGRAGTALGLGRSAPRFEAQAYNKPRPVALSIEFTIIIHDSLQVLKNGVPLLYTFNKVDRRRFDESNP